MLENIPKIITDINYPEIFADYAISNFLDKGVKKITKIINSKNKEWIKENDLKQAKILSDLASMEAAVNFNLKQTYNWCKEVSFKEMNGAKSTSKIFIDLDFYLTPNKYLTEEEIPKRILLKSVLKKIERHLIIIGGPGAGKTTMLKHITNNFYDKNKENQFTAPVVIRLREIDFGEMKYPKIDTLHDVIYSYFGLNINYPNETNNIYEISVFKRRVISEFLDELNILLLIDGFDELPNVKIKESILLELQQIIYSLNKSKVILTTRTGDNDFHIENTKVFEICPLSEKQIEKFASKYIKKINDKNKFLKELKKSPFWDAAMRPLTLAHLCVIFERYNEIPQKPKSIYRRIIRLLLEEWDIQRGINRQSLYDKFDIDRKAEFLANMAYLLTTEIKKSNFSKDDLENCYLRICFNFELPQKQVSKVINEIESHNGLFVQVGYDKFEFAHKSIQEYLVADYIIKLPTLPSNIEEILNIPNELAIAVSISSNPNIYFGILVLDLLKNNIGENYFLKPFLYRIIIEKPDFNSDPILAIALLYIFNKVYFRNHRVTVIDEQILQYINILLEQQTIKNSFSRLNEFYHSNNTQVQVKNRVNEEIFILTEKKLHPKLTQFSIPEKFYINKRILETYKNANTLITES